MLGREHALSGAVVFAALASSLHVPEAHLAAGVVLTAGAGVLPDIDHPDSTIARSFGFLTEWFAWMVARLSGGHRHGTHSLLGIAVFTIGAYGAGLFQLSAPKSLAAGHPAFSWHIVPAALILALLYSSALRALRIGGHHGDLLGIAAALATCFTGADLTQLIVGSWHVPLLAAVTALGCVAHIAGDELTHGGCPILWPVSMHEFHLLPRPLQITTAKFAETRVVFPLLLVGLAAAVWHATGHPLTLPQPSK
ncbi:MAG: metal-dependent hydrolase [Trebonia sp.]